MKKLIFAMLTLVGVWSYSMGQTPTIAPVAGQVTHCPDETKTYEVLTVGAQQTGCKYSWTITNGEIVTEPTLQKVTVIWDNSTAKGTLKVTLSNCVDATNTSASETYVIRSLTGVTPQNFTIKNGGPFPVCDMTPVVLGVSQVIVPNTGFGTNISEYDADGYEWQLSEAANWNGVSSSEQITLTPKNPCAGGTARVRAYVNTCSQRKYSNWTSPINLRGTSALAVTTVGGGNTYTHACGGGNVTFTLANPISCATAYTWTFPSGWKTDGGAASGVITPNTSITLVPPAPGAPANTIAGQVKATANLGSCNVESTALTIIFSDPPLPQPTFTLTPSILCSGQSATANIASISGAESFTWFTVPVYEGVHTNNVLVNGVTATNNSPVNTTTRNVTLQAPVISGSERFGVQLYVRANRVAGCQGSPFKAKHIWVGPPDQASEYFVYVQGYRETNPITLAASAVYTFQIDPVDGATSYQWTLPAGFSFYEGFSQTGYVIKAWTSSTGGTYNLRCYPQGLCGTSGTGNQSLTITIPGAGGGGPTPCTSPPCSTGPLPASVYPTPVGETLYVNLDESLFESDASVDVALQNSFQKIVYSTTTGERSLVIPVETLSEGLYFLRISNRIRIA